MRILHVIHSVDPRGGGPIEGIRQLAPALAARGVEMEVMSLDAPSAPGTTDFPVPLHLTGPSHHIYGYTPRAMPWLRKHAGNYDAVIVNGLWQYVGFAVRRALAGTGVPYFVYPHGMLDPWFKQHYPLKHLKKWVYWLGAEYWVLKDAAGVLFTSEEERLNARKSFKLYRCNERIVGYGIANPPENGLEQKDRFFKQYPHLVGKRLILFLGRIHEKKGCDLLLRAWKKLMDSRRFEEMHLVIAGPLRHAYGSQMQALATKLGIDAQMTWTGMLTGDLKWGSLRAAEAFVLPSHQENFGVSVVEALACGVPALISNKVNIWRELHADQAALVENDDLAGTSQLLERWLALSCQERRTMGLHAKECFHRHFEIGTITQTLIDLLIG